MTQETLTALLLFIGAVFVGVLWILDRTNKRASDSIPSEVMVVLQVVVGALSELSKRTPTALDDQVVDLLKKLLEAQPPALPAPPAPPASPVEVNVTNAAAAPPPAPPVTPSALG